MNSIKFKILIKEEADRVIKQSKVFLVNNTLWLAYTPNSGETANLKNENSYLTNKKDDSNYNSIVNNILIWNNKKTGIFTIPKYDISQNVDQNKLSVFNGKMSGKDKFMVIVKSKDYHIINFFNSKKEANNWIKDKK